MLPLGRRSRFAPPPTALEQQMVPVVSTMVASLAPLLPVVLSEPLLPPFGLMTFIGWRLLRGDIWPLWAGLPLGFWDDLHSGEALGTAMCGWTAILLAIDAVDRRLQWRDHRQDWGLAALAIAAQLLLALALAHAAGGRSTLALIVPQIVLAILLYPIIARICAALDRWRSAG